jgi:hypothetical protein
MAEVTVFVQDAVAGALPAVCVKDGSSTGGVLPVRAQIDSDTAGLGWVWLLLFLGPPGWVALMVVVLWRRPSGGVMVQVPYSTGAQRRLVRTRVTERVAVASVLVLMVGEIIVLLVDPPAVALLSTLAVAIMAVAAVVTVVSALRLGSMEVRARIDRSGQWVVLSEVNSDFAFAARQQVRSHADGLSTDVEAVGSVLAEGSGS